MTAAANNRIASLAADPAVHRAFHWLHLHERRLREWQMQMVAVPAPPFGEGPRAAWFLERFHDLGLADPRLDAVGNAVAWLRPVSRTGDTPCVLLSAHLDTVFPAGTVCTPTEDGPRIVAPGVCDNAAGLTALLAIATAMRFASIDPPCAILFAANVGEEGEGNLRGMRYLFESGRPQRIAAAVVLEGSGASTVVDRALGSRRFRITIKGPGGHSWVDAAQPNPIFALAEVLSSLAQLPLPAKPRTTLQSGTISGGTSVNSIPETASATLDLRSVSPEQLATTAAEAVALMESSVHAVNARAPARLPLVLHIESIGDRPAAVLPPNSALMTSVRAVDRHLSIATEPRVGSTDANLPLSLGIPALAIGCGGSGGGIHTLREWYDPSGRDIALRRILLSLLDVCALANLSLL